MNSKNLKKSVIAFIVLIAMGSAGFDSAYGYGGNSSKKVKICHDGNTITVSERSVKSHLDHGDTKGVCTTLKKVKVASPLVLSGTTVRSNQQYSPLLTDMSTLLLSIQSAKSTGDISEEEAVKFTNQLSNVISAFMSLFR